MAFGQYHGIVRVNWISYSRQRSKEDVAIVVENKAVAGGSLGYLGSNRLACVRRRHWYKLISICPYQSSFLSYVGMNARKFSPTSTQAAAGRLANLAFMP